MNPEQLMRLSELGVATIYEASGQEGLIDIPLIQLIAKSRAAGPARTVQCGQDNNLMVHAAIEQIQPGDVLVLSMPDPRPIALIGELLATQVKFRGAAAILVDAAVRDVDELVNLGLPIWTRYIRVKAAGKAKAGTLNVPVTVGGARISPGDIIVLDSDGAVCIQSDRAEAVLQAAEGRFARETSLRNKLLAGRLTIDLHGLRKTLE